MGRGGGTSREAFLATVHTSVQAQIMRQSLQGDENQRSSMQLIKKMILHFGGKITVHVCTANPQ